MGLRGAKLVKLDPLETFKQHSSLVVLHGSLRATSEPDKPPRKPSEKPAMQLPRQSAHARLSSLFSIEGSPPDKPSVIQEEPDDSAQPPQEPAEASESEPAPTDEPLRSRGRKWLEGCSQQRQSRRGGSASPSVSPGPLPQHLAPCVLPWLWDFALDR